MSTIITPWQSGTVIENTEGIPAALNFKVRTTGAYYKADTSLDEYLRAGNMKVIMREDTGQMLGFTGKRYTPYQNEDMWDVITAYCKETGGVIDKVGNFGNNSFSWAVVKHNDYEVVKGDPITKFDMFVNPFTGQMSVTLINTDVRIVCGNALSGALKHNDGLYRIGHHSNVEEKFRIAVEASAASVKAREKHIEYMKHLAKTKISPDLTQDLTDKLFTVKENSSSRVLNRVSTFNNLIESGKGADLPGVRGTAYGFLQAAIEFADHHMQIRGDSNAKLHSTLMGSIAEFKARAGHIVNHYALAA